MHLWGVSILLFNWWFRSASARRQTDEQYQTLIARSRQSGMYVHETLQPQTETSNKRRPVAFDEELTPSDDTMSADCFKFK